MDKARQKLIWAGAALCGGFAALAMLVARGLPLGPDLMVARAVQAVPWGPVTPVLYLLDYVDGWRQVALGAAVVALVFVLQRSLGRVALACAVSAPAYYLIGLVVQRPRPPSTLVHVVRHASGYSFPSGHEVFYTWALALVVIAVAGRVPWVRVPAAMIAVLVLATIAASRIAVGEHWPSDCLGGLLLGGGWTLLVIGWLGQPDRERLPGVKPQTGEALA